MYRPAHGSNTFPWLFLGCVFTCAVHAYDHSCLHNVQEQDDSNSDASTTATSHIARMLKMARKTDV